MKKEDYSTGISLYLKKGHASLEDIRLGADLVRVGDNMLCLHTLSDTDDLPTTVSTDSRYERLSTDRSDLSSFLCLARRVDATL